MNLLCDTTICPCMTIMWCLMEYRPGDLYGEVLGLYQTEAEALKALLATSPNEGCWYTVEPDFFIDPNCNNSEIHNDE